MEINFVRLDKILLTDWIVPIAGSSKCDKKPNQFGRSHVGWSENFNRKLIINRVDD